MGELPGVESLEHQDLLQVVEHLVLRLVPMKPSLISGVLEFLHPALDQLHRFPAPAARQHLADLLQLQPLHGSAAFGADAMPPPWEPTSPKKDVVFAPNNHFGLITFKGRVDDATARVKRSFS